MNHITLGEILVLKFVDDRSAVDWGGFPFFLRRDATLYKTVLVGKCILFGVYYFWEAKPLFCSFRLKENQLHCL